MAKCDYYDLKDLLVTAEGLGITSLPTALLHDGLEQQRDPNPVSLLKRHGLLPSSRAQQQEAPSAEGRAGRVHPPASPEKAAAG